MNKQIEEIPSFLISQGSHAMKTGELSLTANGSGGKSIYEEWMKQAHTEGVNDSSKKLPYINPYNCVEECRLYGAYLDGYNSVSEE